MNDKKDRILEINSEIDTLEKKVAKFKSRTPYAIIVGVLFSFIYPYVPRKYGGKTMVEDWDYLNAVFFMAVMYFVIYVISYYYVADKNRKTIESLRRRLFSLENNDKPYTRGLKK